MLFFFFLFFFSRTQVRAEEVLPKQSSFFIFQSRVLFSDCFYFCQQAKGSSTAIKDVPDSCLEKMDRLTLQECLKLSAVVFLHDTVLFSVLFFHLFPASECSSFQRTHAHFPLCSSRLSASEVTSCYSSVKAEVEAQAESS